MTTRILLLRHGEKPKKGHELNLRGQIRAAALAPYLVATFGKPDALYATKFCSEDLGRRTQETLQPLADKLNLPVVTNWVADDFGEQAKELLSTKTNGTLSIVCWEHNAIPGLAKALGAKKPPEWKDKNFDRVWELVWPGVIGEETLELHFHKQSLLYGDK